MDEQWLCETKVVLCPHFEANREIYKRRWQRDKKVKGERHIARSFNSIQERARPVVLAFPRLSPDPFRFYTAVPYRRHLNFSILLCHRLTGIWGLFLALIIISVRIYDTFATDLALRKTKRSQALCHAGYRFSCAVLFLSPNTPTALKNCPGDMEYETTRFSFI